MPTLAQLGVEIDPTGAKAGGAQAEDAINRIALAADKMAAAVDRFTAVAQQTGAQGSAALQKVEKAADEVTTSLKESGAAAQTAGNQTTTAATASSAAATRNVEAVDRLTTAHKASGTAAESAGSMAATSATEAVGAHNRLAEAVEQTASVQKTAGTIAFDAMEAMARGAQMQAAMTAEATQAAHTLNTAWTQVAENHWTQQTEAGLVNIIDSSMALTARTKEQVDAEFALMQAVRSRETASTSANRAYADQMNAAATASMKGGGTDPNNEAASAERAAATYRKQVDAARQEAEDAARKASNGAAYAGMQAQQASTARASGDVPGAQDAAFSAQAVATEAKAAAEAAKEMADIAKEAYRDVADAAKAAATETAAVEREAANDAANATRQFAADAQAAYKEAAAAAKEAAADAEGAVKDAAQAQAQAEKEAAAAAAQAAKEQAAAEKAAAAQVKADAKEAADAAKSMAKEQADAFAAGNKSSLAGTTDGLHELSSLLFGLAPLFGSLQGQITQTGGLLSAAALGFSKVTGNASDQQEKMKTLTAAYERLNVANAQVASLSKDAAATAEQMAAAQSEQAVAAGAAAAAEDAAAASTGFLLLAAIPLVAILAAATLAALAFAAAWKFVSSSIAAGSQFVTLHTRFSQFVGDAKAAHDELEHLQELSARSGLDLPDLEQGEAHLIAFGAGLKEASQEMTNFATISVRSGKDSIQALETLYATARDQGNVTMRQVMQLRTANVDLMPQLRAQTGLTGVQLQHMLSQGNVSFQQLKDAIDSTAESMKSLEIRANTPEGVMDSIAIHYKQLKEAFGEPISLALVPLLQTVDEKVKGMLPDATASGTFAGNLITAINGAVKNGELGSLIYEVITTGTAKGWAYVDQNWFQPAKKAISDIFGAANFGAAFTAVSGNIYSYFIKLFKDGGAIMGAEIGYALDKVVIGIMERFPKLFGENSVPATMYMTPAARSAPLLDQNQKDYDAEVQRRNAVYVLSLNENGIATDKVTGSFGALVTSTDILAQKLAGIDPKKYTPPPPAPQQGVVQQLTTASLGAAVTGTPVAQYKKDAYTNAFLSPQDMFPTVDFDRMAAKERTELLAKVDQHNAVALSALMDPLINAMGGGLGVLPGQQYDQASGRFYTPIAPGSMNMGSTQPGSPNVFAPPPAPPAPPAAPAAPSAPPASPIQVRRAVLVKTNGEVVSLGDVGGTGDLPQGGGPVVRGSLMPQVQALLPGQRMPGINQSAQPNMPVDPANMGHANPNNPWGDAAAALNANTVAVGANTKVLQPLPGALSNVHGIASDFGRLMNGQVDGTDEGRKKWDGEAHYGAPILGHYDLTDPNLQGAAISKQQAIDLTGIQDWQKAMASLNGVTLIATNSLTGLSTAVKAVDIGPGHNPAGVQQVELTGAANNQLQSYRGGNISLSLAGANVKVDGAQQDDGHLGGMPIFNRSLDSGLANRPDALPHGTPVTGTEPAPNLGNIQMDQDAIDKMVIEINNYNAALQRGLITQEEFNKRVDELRGKTISGLTDPNGGRNGVSFGQQINNQARNVGNGAASQYDPMVTAHRIALDKMTQDQKRADDLMKTNDEGVTLSFIAGMQKAAQAYGTFDQQVAKMGSTVINDMVGGIANAIGEISSGTKTASQAFRDMAVSMLQDLSKLMIEMALLLIIKQALGWAGGAIGGSVGGAISGVANSIGTAGVHHTGGIAGSPTVTRQVDMSVFNGARRFHDGGILPGEVPIIAQPGEGVFTPEQMANLAPAGSVGGGSSTQQNSFSTNITINSDGSSNSQTHGTGTNDARETGRQLDALVKSTLVNETRKGGILDQWSSARGRR